MTRFRTLYQSLVPSWLQDGEGGLALYSLGAVLDAAQERLRLGTLARFPTYAPDDALPYIGRDRKLVRGINEPSAAYAARLLRWLDDHRVRGNPFALHAQLRAYMQADIMVRTVDRRGNWYTTSADGTRSVTLAAGNWDWDGTSTAQWARFWVILYPLAGVPWGKAATYPGTDASADQVASVMAIIRDWKPAGTTCEWVINAYDAALFDPSDADLGGTWGNWSEADGSDVVRSRQTNARYWKAF